MATRVPRRWLGFALTVSLAGLPGCGSPTSPGTPVPVQHLASGDISFPTASAFSASIAPAQHRVVSDSATWAFVWSELFNFSSSAPAPPAVDFSQSVVLFTAMGAEPSSGYNTAIGTVTVVNDQQLLIEVAETSPGPGCVVSTVVTHPVDAVVVPRTTTPTVNFEVTKSQASCGS